jgi:hypothetical protein
VEEETKRAVSSIAVGRLEVSSRQTKAIDSALRAVEDERLGLKDGAGWFAADVGGVADVCCRQLRLLGASDRACSPGSIVMAEPMYMRCAARSSSTSSFASTGRKRTVIDPFTKTRKRACSCTGQMPLRRLSATMNEQVQLIYWAWRPLLRLAAVVGPLTMRHLPRD